MTVGLRRIVAVCCSVSFLLGLVGTSAAQAPKALVIGIDGLSPYALVHADLPNIRQLIDGSFATGYAGHFTPHAYAGGDLSTIREQATVSGPGWSSILTGVWKDKHGVTNNGFGGRDFENHPTWLETLEEEVPNFYSASVARWTPIDTFIISSVDDANSSMDHRSSPNSDQDVAVDSAQILSQMDSARPGALFVHLDDVDGAGHQTGLFSQNFVNVAQNADLFVGVMLQAIRNRPTFAQESWKILLTADHGHRPGGGHGGQTALERAIPFVLTEKGTGGGTLLTSVDQPSMVDIGGTVLPHFGVTIPSSYEGIDLSGAGRETPMASLRDGLVAHLPLDGDASAGLAGIAANVQGQVQFSAGKFGQAAGVTNYGDGFIQLANSLNFGAGQDFTMAMWVQHDGFSSDPAFFSNKDWTSGSNTGINLAFNPNNTLDFNTKAAGGSRADLHPWEALPPGEWRHVAFTVDRDGATSLYVNGILAGQIENSSNGSFSNLAWTLLNDGTGNYQFSSSTNGLKIDEFAAWNRLLSLDELLTLSNRAIEPTADIDDDGQLDINDLDTLVAAIASNSTDQRYDVNGDRQIDPADRDAWLAAAGAANLPSGLPYLLADANLDGIVDGIDFVAWNDNKFTATAAWSAGDFNADGAIDGQDFILWNENKFQAADSLIQVPEPSGFWVWLLAFAPLGKTRRRPI